MIEKRLVSARPSGSERNLSDRYGRNVSAVSGDGRTSKTVQMQQQQQKEQRSRMPEECRKILEEGQEYITYIHKCNDDLPGEEITRKLAALKLSSPVFFRKWKNSRNWLQICADL